MNTRVHSHTCTHSHLLFIQRQGIDARFPTGSGQKADGDFLDDEEQAICDWIGEDISLGML